MAKTIANPMTTADIGTKKRMSAATSDRLADAIEVTAQPRSRRELVADLADALSAEQRERDSLAAELQAADEAVERHEYQRRLDRRRRARSAFDAVTIHPDRRSSMARKALIESLTEDERTALHRLEIDIQRERQSLTCGTYSTSKRVAAATARLKFLNQPHGCETQVDVLKAVQAYRRDNSVPEGLDHKRKEVESNDDWSN